MGESTQSQQDPLPRVCVVVLHCNGRHHLEYCLPSLAATDYANTELVLVDNGSTDDSVAFTRKQFPQVRIIENDANIGWAAGNNVGIRYALDHDAEFIVLQNNDTKVDPHWLSAAVEVCESDPRIGMVGFDMLQEYIQGEDPDGAKFEERSAAWKELAYEPATHVTGAALFVRTRVFRDVGLIDEGYFAYAGEDDLERRAAKAGYRMVRVNVPLWHYNGGFWQGLLKSSMLAMRSSIRCVLKNETRHEAWRQIRWTVDFVCSRDVEYDQRIPHFRRLRPSNRVVNCAILAYAFLWNLIVFPATLRARREDEWRIVQAQRRREMEHSAGPGREAAAE